MIKATSPAAFRDGMKAVAPLTVPVIPFGLVFGVAVNESVISSTLGWASSWIIFAGSAQLATIVIFDAGGGFWAVIATAAIVNARHIIYSAALQPRFRTFSWATRLLSTYLLTDQAYAVTSLLPDDAKPAYVRRYFLGAGVLLWTTWNAATTLGVAVGEFIPQEWGFTFAVPLNFGALMMLAITSRPAVLAAVTGGTAAVMLQSLPNGSGLLAGALLGICAGGFADWVGEAQQKNRLQH